jgi:hypothetical protein
MGRLRGIVLVVIGLMSVISYSPPIAGSTGVSVDAEGHLIIVLAWCEGAAPEGVSISHDEDTSGSLAAMPSPSSAATVVTDVDFIAPPLTGSAHLSGWMPQLAIGQ